MLAFTLMNVGWNWMRSNHCAPARSMFSAAMLIAVALLSLSFFSFFKCLDLLALSTLSRQFLQLLQYCFVGHRPPRMLYVTDGGVRDCTGIVQLMRRRCKRILLVLAAGDPTDDMLALKKGMAVAEEEKIGTFYDTQDPRRSIQAKIEAFGRDKSQLYLHLGICYPQAGDEEISGHLYVVKNRLPPAFEGQPIEPPLTEDEVQGRSSTTPGFRHGDWQHLTTDQLGGYGCCDCCHTAGLNCGPKFPHGGFPGYLYLTPTWCNSLVRLGFAVSEDAVKAVTKDGSLARPWERLVKEQD